MWVAYSDYHSDIKASPEILKQLSEAYKKIRNTARFILGNLSNGEGFNPDVDMVSDAELMEIDKWAILRLDALLEKSVKAYDNFEFHVVFHAIHNFCVTEMSNFYLDIIKDRLYCEDEKSLSRRAAQTAMYKVLSGLTRLIAPIMSFTAEEIWSHIPHAASDDARSVMLNQIPGKSGIAVSDDFNAKWTKIYNLRDDVKKALEIKRNEKLIGASLEANVVIHIADEVQFNEVKNTISEDELANIFIVSGVSLVNDANGEMKSDSNADVYSYSVEKASGEKCERCWIYSDDVGESAEHPTLCKRCASVVK